MSEAGRGRRWTEAGLIAGISVPFLYFGTQAVSMPLYPGYDLLRQPASALGSDSAPWASVFNAGAILTGLATLAAAYGVGRALAALGGWRFLAVLTALALVSSGAASVNAGLFHLPDPRHNPGWLGIGTFLFPLIMLIAAWPLPDSRRLKIMLIAGFVAIAALAPIMGGLTGIDRAAYGGLLQRLVALALFVPVGISAYWLLRRLRAAPSA